jgi:hypothetical protein
MPTALRARCAQCGSLIPSSATPYFFNGETICIGCLDMVEPQMPEKEPVAPKTATARLELHYVTAYIVQWVLGLAGIACLVIGLLAPGLPLLATYDRLPNSSAEDQSRVRAQRERLAAEFGGLEFSGLCLIGLGQVLRCTRDLAVHARTHPKRA